MPSEPAKPTRFEWPEEDDVNPSPVSLYSPSFDSISYDSELLVKPAKRPIPPDNQEPSSIVENNQSLQEQLQNPLSFAEKVSTYLNQGKFFNDFLIIQFSYCAEHHHLISGFCCET